MKKERNMGYLLFKASFNSIEWKNWARSLTCYFLSWCLVLWLFFAFPSMIIVMCWEFIVLFLFVYRLIMGYAQDTSKLWHKSGKIVSDYPVKLVLLCVFLLVAWSWFCICHQDLPAPVMRSCFLVEIVDREVTYKMF